MAALPLGTKPAFTVNPLLRVGTQHRHPKTELGERVCSSPRSLREQLGKAARPPQRRLSGDTCPGGLPSHRHDDGTEGLLKSQGHKLQRDLRLTREGEGCRVLA